MTYAKTLLLLLITCVCLCVHVWTKVNSSMCRVQVVHNNVWTTCRLLFTCARELSQCAHFCSLIVTKVHNVWTTCPLLFTRSQCVNNLSTLSQLVHKLWQKFTMCEQLVHFCSHVHVSRRYVCTFVHILWQKCTMCEQLAHFCSHVHNVWTTCPLCENLFTNCDKNSQYVNNLSTFVNTCTWVFTNVTVMLRHRQWLIRPRCLAAPKCMSGRRGRVRRMSHCLRRSITVTFPGSGSGGCLPAVA